MGNDLINQRAARPAPFYLMKELQSLALVFFRAPFCFVQQNFALETAFLGGSIRFVRQDFATQLVKIANEQ